MRRKLCLPVVAILCVTLAAQSADKPKTEMDYQKYADEAQWKPPAEDFRYCLMMEARGYQVETIRKKGEALTLTIRISDGESELYSFKGHHDTVFFERDGVLYHAQYSPTSNGCQVVAFDLKAKKQLWKTELKGIGDQPHSAYHNEVRMASHQADVLVVYGLESLGKYVEVLDLKTGKTVGHKVFKEEKK